MDGSLSLDYERTLALKWSERYSALEIANLRQKSEYSTRSVPVCVVVDTISLPTQRNFVGLDYSFQDLYDIR